jgi:hypothetical protein
MSFVDILESVAERVMPSLGKKVEERRLARLSTESCNVDKLLKTTPTDIVAALGSAEAAAEWEQTAREIQAFELPDSTGGVNKGDQRALYYMLRHFRPATILEIGTHIGSSTLTMALAARRLRQLNPPTATTICTVDLRDVNDPVQQPWKQYASKTAPREMIAKVFAPSPRLLSWIDPTAISISFSSTAVTRRPTYIKKCRKHCAGCGRAAVFYCTIITRVCGRCGTTGSWFLVCISPSRDCFEKAIPSAPRRLAHCPGQPSSDPTSPVWRS